MSENRRPSGMSPGPGPGYPHQGQYMSPAMAVNAQRYMMGQVRPGQMSPMSSHGYNQQVSGSCKESKKARLVVCFGKWCRCLGCISKDCSPLGLKFIVQNWSNRKVLICQTTCLL